MMCTLVREKATQICWWGAQIRCSGRSFGRVGRSFAQVQQDILAGEFAVPVIPERFIANYYIFCLGASSSHENCGKFFSNSRRGFIVPVFSRCLLCAF